MTPQRKPVPAVPRLCLAVLALLLAAGCDTTPDKRLLQNPVEAEEWNWVAIGDGVHVKDSYHPDEIVANVTVDFDGTVLLPKLGRVQVAGRTGSEIRSLLIERYKTYYELLDLQVEVAIGGKKYFTFDESGRIKILRTDPQDPRILIGEHLENVNTLNSTGAVESGRGCSR
jgi:hypothetical protein